MLAIRLDKKNEARLTRLAHEAGRTKAAYAREALLEHMQDLAAAKLAQARQAKPGKIYPAAALPMRDIPKTKIREWISRDEAELKALLAAKRK